MIQTRQEEGKISFTLPSRVELVDDLVSEVRGFLKRSGMRDDARLILALRELANNGIEHGNHRDENLSLLVELERLGENRVRLRVEDQGAGFDHESLDLSLPDDPTKLRNRGLGLVNNFADQLIFEEKGNIVEAYMTIKPETYFQVTEDGDWQVIRPSGDLTARVADEFRQTLLGLFEGGHKSFRFDLAQVEDIDSITLSIFVIFSNTLLKKFPDAQLEVTSAGKDIVNMFQLTRLDRSYRITQ